MNVTLHFINEGIALDVAAGTRLLQAQRDAGLLPDAPCGGSGTCGKCLADIRGAQDCDWQRVKCCQTVVDRDLWVRTVVRVETNVLTQGEKSDTLWEPQAEILALQIPPQSSGENNSPDYRLIRALERATCCTGWQADLSRIRCPEPLLSEAGGKLWAAVCSNSVLELWEQPRQVYMAAFDIGTTTLAGYLLSSEGAIARKGMPNPQAQFGADVILRADHAMKHGTQQLSQCVRSALDSLLGMLCSQAGICREAVLAVSVVGNTCMHHLFLGISPASLALAPYTPTVRDGMVLSCADYGIHVHSNAPLFVLPVIAGFVGADTVGCLLAGDWAHREKLTLLIDIGTNGEIVLGNRHRMIACSTAAGPAFEGALISCGMRGAPGAVDHVWLENGAVCHSVIGGGKALGICGSGLIDLAAVLLRRGDMDETGALNVGNSFVLPGTEITLTQKDIRQMQLAKAAISAGIRLLAQQWGTALEEIEEVCVAGAFGSFMNPQSACDIGLIPNVLRQKIRLTGNSAGEGAQMVLRSQSLWDCAQIMARSAEFLELATISDFQDTFIDELEFPEL